LNFTEDVLERFPAARPALVEITATGERRVWHFGELVAMSAGLSGAMASRGVHREDVVMTLVGNRLEWVLAMLACWRMGAVALPCNTQLRRKDLELRLAAANPALVIGEEELLGEMPSGHGVETMTMAEIAPVLDDDISGEPPVEAADLGPDDPALIVFTSGTTGEPRAALHPQRYIAGQAIQAEHWFGADEGDLCWCTAASGWSKSARNAFVAPWLRGAAALIHNGRFDPADRLAVVEREGVTVLCQAPTEYRMLARRTELRPVEGLRRMVSAGEALNPEVIGAFEQATGLTIADGYGQTETGAVTGIRPGDPAKPGSMGRPLPGITTRIAAPGRGAEEAASGVGELQLLAASSPTFFSRYLDGEPFDGEWWPTGDLVEADEEGFLTHVGRADDLISSAGYRIGPVEVESALLSHPAVAEAAAVAAPDEERGSVVRAIVVLRGDAQPSDSLAAELQEHVKSETAPYKYPRIVDFAAELPKTASGKIKRAELRGES
jgi:acetyl-CoA synthetase